MSDYYKSRILEAYRKKQAANTLSPNLTDPTPGKLRVECLLVCQERYLKKDEPMLRIFFGKREDQQGYLKAIDNLNVDKFRPLNNFLKGGTSSPDDKNIELLAWLIDFEPRPAGASPVSLVSTSNVTNVPAITPPEPPQEDQQKEIGVTEEPPIPISEPDKTTIGSPQQEAEATTPKLSSSRLIGQSFLSRIIEEPPKGTRSTKLTALWGTFMVIALGSAVAIWYAYTKGPVLTGTEKCMYWSGDQYQPASCNLQLKDTLLIALDTAKLVHFRQITKPDTLTEHSLGKVWYIKIDGNMEFYTEAGFHPVHMERRLKPVTSFTLTKYVAHH